VNRLNSVRRRSVTVVVAAVVVLLVGVAAVRVWPHDGEQHLTVDFTRTVSLYPGSTVRILGVSVGTVDSVQPLGTKVRVKLSWNARYPVPADVHAVIVSPAIVGDRFIQLTPAYDGGKKLPDHSFLDQARTKVPVELDETYAALDQLASALGPRGANQDGALARLLHNGAQNLDGQGARLNRSIAALAKLTGTFADNKDQLFDGITKLAHFVDMLDTNDAAVREFNSSLGDVSGVLAGERTDLSAALSSLADSLGEVRQYVAENRATLKSTVAGLTSLTRTLATQKQNLADVLTRGPEAIARLVAAYDPSNGTLNTRGLLKAPDNNDFSLLTNPAIVSAYCGLASGQNPDQEETCYDVGRVLQQLATALPASGSSIAAASGRSPASTHADPGVTGTATPGGIEAMMGVTP
jgi:phospholipid/cholesterol/gamma-HCH transport system substrate-binding protein